jgi:hypothetical protein
MDDIMVLLWCVTFVFLLYFVLKSIQYKEKVDTWKEISKMQDELIGHLRNKNSIQEDMINAYKSMEKHDQSMIDIQKQYINELLEILKTQK